MPAYVQKLSRQCLLSSPPLPRPVRPEPPLDTDGHIVFCHHEQHPACEVLLYRKLSGYSRRSDLSISGKLSVSERGVGKCVDTGCWLRGQDEATLSILRSIHQRIDVGKLPSA